MFCMLTRIRRHRAVLCFGHADFFGVVWGPFVLRIFLSVC